MLRQRLNDLERALLPTAQDPLGNYPAEQEVRTRAFLVLAHAEFESFLEKECRRVAQIALRKIQGGQFSFVALSINSYFSGGASPIPDTFLNASIQGKNALDWKLRSDSCFEAYEQSIISNNGIKQYNLVRLLSPLGLDLNALATAMLVECDNFGELRGNLAHGKAQQVVDPFSEKTKVDALEAFFSQVAQAIKALP